jgi:hypothetical protein
MTADSAITIPILATLVRALMILKKLGFLLVGTIDHPEDGLVWEWQLSSSSTA